MTGKTELDVDLTDRSLYSRGVPHGLFTRMRDTAAVSWHPPVEVHPGQGEAGFWSVFRHAEIVRVQRDWETFTATDGVEINKASYDHAVAMLTSMDPPRHTRLRRLITAGFTPRMIGRLEEHLVQPLGLVGVACDGAVLDAQSGLAEQVDGVDAAKFEQGRQVVGPHR